VQDVARKVNGRGLNVRSRAQGALIGNLRWAMP
jgi:hypothetical protein